MKKIIAIALVAMMAFAMLIPVNAAQISGDVLKGTPVVDGALDEIFTQSASYELDNFGFYNWGDCTGTDSAATAYFLWDSDYLYYAVVVKDSTPLSAGADAGWQNDAAECWFVDENLKFKVHSAADGNFFLGTDGDGATAFTFENAKHASAWTDDGYVVEIALPMNNLNSSKTFTFSLQVNDIVVEDFSSGSASGSQAADAEFKCVDTEVTYPVVEEVVEEVPAAADETAAPATETAAAAPAAAQTSDAVIAVVALMAIAGAGYVCTKKFLNK